ncbi:MAG: ABC transporter permease, partial [Candidatus Bathyarchaeia archaeon]
TTLELLEKSESYYEQKLYSKAYPLYLAAWTWAYRAYNDEVMPLIDDSARTSLFFFALIIPTSLFIEKLTVHSEGRRRLLYVILTGLFLVLMFTLVHPAIRIMNNSVMGLMGVLSMLIFVLTLVILGEETERIMREISFRLLGYHRVEVGRTGLAMTSFSTALENMRKRKLRTLLTLATVVSIALAVTALTSVSTYVFIKRPSIPYSAGYDGLMLKIGFGAPPDGVLQPYLVNVLKGVVEKDTLVLPRVFYYPQSIGPNLGVVAQISPEAKIQQNITSTYRGMLGLTSEDSYVLLGEAIREGRNFTEWEYFSCILPKSMADRMNVTYGDVVVTLGMRLKVVGLFDDGLMNMTRELDNMMPLPMDPLYFSALGLGYQATAQQTPPQLLWSNIIVVPYRLALDLGGYVGQISIRFTKHVSQGELLNLADRIALSTDVNVYVGYNGTVSRSSRVAAFSLTGWEVVPAIIVIGALNVAVTLIGNVKERTKDMFIYSAVGLSPFGAMIMFIIETTVYAFVGVIAGYFLGFALNAGLISLNILPPNFTFNYASVFAIISLSIVIVAAVASSIYPASIASRMITPSLERKWKPATKPKGEIWEVPLPLSLPTQEEAAGFIEYLNEYYAGAGAQKSTFTVRQIRNLSTAEPSIELLVALSPYEMAITQLVKISGFMVLREQRFDFNIYMQKLTGPTNVWAVTSYYFVDDLRKQALLWRSLTAEEHRKYIERALSRIIL